MVVQADLNVGLDELTLVVVAAAADFDEIEMEPDETKIEMEPDETRD